MNNAYIRAQQCKVKEAKFPFVKIGEQYWTTKNLSLAVTPQGNTIPEMQANGNVERVVNGGFDTDTVWSKGTGWTISNGIASSNTTVVPTDLRQSVLTIGKWYILSLDIVSLISGYYQAWNGSNISFSGNSTGHKSVIFLATSYQSLVISSMANTVGVIDNISCKEIGWSGSQELYDGIYAQTTGTVEQKTYAAVKAAAMWSNYNNSVDNGAIYGKLYNWFAVKLFQMDIDYYNAANPTKPYIWRMPTQAEFQALSTYLGGDAVSGGHLKEAGLAHWTIPNTGADNSSGFMALPGGYRDPLNGTFINNTTYAIFWSITKYRYILTQVSQSVDGGIRLESSGFSIRLIKA